MKIQDFCDMNKFEQIMKNWANSTGLATVAVGADGKYISDCYNFTEFCIDLTRGSAEGKKRCEQCDREGHGVYPCHAGLVDFGIPITLEDGTVLGSIIGGQVLPENPDEEKFRQTARELGIDEDKYIKALKKVNVKTKEQIDASANLLGDVINMFVRSSYAHRRNTNLVGELKGGIADAAQQIIDEDMQIEGSEKTSLWKGKEGACPHCQGNNFYIYPGTTHCVCELCGLEGTLEIVDGAFKFKYDPATEHHAHDILSGKFLHGQDIFENEGRLMNLYKDPEFKKRKEHYTAVCEPTPAPSKQK